MTSITANIRASLFAIAPAAGLALLVIPGSVPADAHPHRDRDRAGETITCPVDDKRQKCVAARKALREAREELRRTVAEMGSDEWPGFDPEEMKRDLRESLSDIEEMDFAMLDERERERIRFEIRQALEEVDFDAEEMRREMADGRREVEEALRDLEAKDGKTIRIVTYGDDDFNIQDADDTEED